MTVVSRVAVTGDPVRERSRMTTTDDHDYRLADRMESEVGQAVLNGVQALVRGPLDQIRADRRHGADTAALVTGYQGSPLGTVDMVYDRHRALFEAENVRFIDGVNEELAATMIWGSQQAVRGGNGRHDGVLGLWFGKGPGLDRAGDAIRHANLAGVGPTDGVILAVGDDPACKSSTAPSSSEATLADLALPTLYPGSPQDVLDFARHAYEMSRVSGAWIGMKIHTDVADGSGTVDVNPERLTVIHEPFDVAGVPWRATPDDMIITPNSVAIEHESHSVRPRAAAHHVTVNGLDRIIGATDAWLTIVAAGKAYFDLRGALARLGLDTDRQVTDLGIRILKPALIWPLAEASVRRAVRGVETVLVVEDKRPFLETSVKTTLYGSADQPLVLGKTDENGSLLIPSIGSLDPDGLVEPLRSVLERRVDPGRLTRRRERIPLVERATTDLPGRTPFFCSGCPHNRSTVIPAGSTAGGGIGCHTMAVMEDRAVGVTQMGGEGAQWVGQAPFVTESHRFQNIGDGTFAHSGFLAVRQAISAGTDITYKILYNGTVAMTGGQDAAGVPDVPSLTRLLDAEGAAGIAVVTDDPGKYADDARFAPGTRVAHRDDLDRIQRDFREVAGTTVVIYDQGCAAELRRARKRGTIDTPTTRVVINEAVCDGCGHCGEISNCMSVHPVQTPFGRKTRIHQESCNLDLSCVDGECPAFITVEIGEGPSAEAPLPTPDLPDLPEPRIPTTSTILTVGIGGTGVVTVNQLLTTAAHLDGKRANGLDQTGLAQKGGPVVSHLRIGTEPNETANRIAEGEADAFLVFDMVAGVAPANISRTDPERTTAVVSTSRVPTGHMVADRDQEEFPTVDRFRQTIDATTRADANAYVDAEGIARALFRSQPAANLVLLGVAYQRGLLPVSGTAIERAIELNGVAVEQNQRAFTTGRAWAVDPGCFAGLVPPGEIDSPPEPTQAVNDLLDVVPSDDAALRDVLAWRLPELVAFGGRPWAERYVERIARVVAAERAITHDSELSRTVARHLAAFMTYKDEYEVARLHRDPAVVAGITARFGADAKISYRLKPPTLTALGHDRKIGLGRRTGGAVFGVLARMRRLRDTPFDPFGRTEERRTERALIVEYEELVDALVAGLDAPHRSEAIRIAGLADRVRGYGHVKAANVATYRNDLQLARAGWDRRHSSS